MRKTILVTTFLIVLIAVACPPGSAQEKVNPPQDTLTPPQAADPELVLPEGTVIPIVLSSYLNTRSSQAGDRFYADVAYPVYIQQRLVIPRGTVVRGSVTMVERPGRMKGKGKIAVRIENVLLPNGISRDMIAAFRGIHGPGTEKLDRKSETVTNDGSKGEDTGTIIGSTGQGAVIGAISGGGKGAGIGAGAGAAVGLATVLFTRGQELILQPGTQFDLELKQPMRFAYGEIDFAPGQTNPAGAAYTPRPQYDRNQQNRRPIQGRRPWGIPWPW